MASNALVLFLLLPQPSDPSITESTDYYEVTGATAAELRTSMTKNRPGGEESGIGDGQTEWDVRWRCLFEMQEECVVTSVSIDLTIKITLPRWSPSPAVSAELVGRWNRFMQSLKVHEAGHAEIGRQAAHAVEQRLKEVGRFADCRQLDAAIEAAGEEVVREFSGKNLRYDLRTINGLTQGATFP